MYYPYLRGKQFELKALRDYSLENKNEDKILPIIEPVNQSTNVLSLAIDQLKSNGMLFSMIMNPNDGDFRHKTVSFDILSLKPDLKENKGVWIPAYLYQGDPSRLDKEITDSPWDEVILVFKTCADVDNLDVAALISNAKVKTVVNNFGKTVSRRVKRAIKDLGKSLVCFEDCFVNKKRNADYLNDVDEPFSEMFYYWKDDGFDGFGDYTALPSEYAEGGMLPYALAIHLTYRKAEDQIYVHHFVSDNNFDQSNIKGKFYEAASKIEPFFERRIHTASVDELISKANNPDGYPGLGYLKKLSVKNHLELIKQVIK